MPKPPFSSSEGAVRSLRASDPRAWEWVSKEVVRPLVWGPEGFRDTKTGPGGQRFDGDEVVRYVIGLLWESLTRFDSGRSPDLGQLKAFLRRSTERALQKYLRETLRDSHVELVAGEDSDEDDEDGTHHMPAALEVNQFVLWTRGEDDDFSQALENLDDDQLRQEFEDPREVHGVIESLLDGSELGPDHRLIRSGFLTHEELLAIADAVSIDGLRIDTQKFALCAEDWCQPPTEPNRRANSALLRLLLGDLIHGLEQCFGTDALREMMASGDGTDLALARAFLAASPDERRAQLSRDRNYGVSDRLFRELQQFYVATVFGTPAAAEDAAYLETESGRRSVFDAQFMGYVSLGPMREIHADLVELLRTPLAPGTLLEAWRDRTVRHRVSALGVLASFDLLSRLAASGRRASRWGGDAESEWTASFLQQFVEPVKRMHDGLCPRCQGEIPDDIDHHSGVECLRVLMGCEASQEMLREARASYWLASERSQRAKSLFGKLLNCHSDALEHGHAAWRTRFIMAQYDQAYDARTSALIRALMAAFESIRHNSLRGES